MNSFRFSLRMLFRDWRAGELNVLILALVIAISSLTTVGFFADRVELALARESNQLLGADLLVISSQPIPDTLTAEASRRGLAVSSLIKFPSMISNGDSNLLTEIKAVTEGYPLRGRINLADQFSINGDVSTPAHRVAEGIPLPGTIWIDEKVMTRLELKPGDRVDVGMTQLAFKAKALSRGSCLRVSYSVRPNSLR